MLQIPFALQCTIPENQLLPLKDSIDGYLKTDIFSNIAEFEYFLGIFLNGDNGKCPGKTSICLFLKLKNVKKVEADFIVTIESANYSEKSNSIYESFIGWGPYICSTEEFFDPEKKYFIFFDIKPGIKICIFFRKNDDSKTHKFIHFNRSEVFAAMFKSNMKESKENKITIPDFSFNIVEAALKLIYECTFTSSLSINELMSLLQFFDKYDLPSLKDKVESYLINQISASTVVRLVNGSIQTNSFKLKEKCMDFLMVAFQSKTALADIKILDKDIALEILENTLYQDAVIKN